MSNSGERDRLGRVEGVLFVWFTGGCLLGVFLVFLGFFFLLGLMISCGTHLNITISVKKG